MQHPCLHVHPGRAGPGMSHDWFLFMQHPGRQQAVPPDGLALANRWPGPERRRASIPRRGAVPAAGISPEPDELRPPAGAPPCTGESPGGASPQCHPRAAVPHAHRTGLPGPGRDTPRWLRVSQAVSGPPAETDCMAENGGYPPKTDTWALPWTDSQFWWCRTGAPFSGQVSREGLM